MMKHFYCFRYAFHSSYLTFIFYAPGDEAQDEVTQKHSQNSHHNAIFQDFLPLRAARLVELNIMKKYLTERRAF